MTWSITGLPDKRRRVLRSAAVTCAVVAGHAALLAVMCLEMKPVMVTDTGDGGQIVMASLINAMPAEAEPEARKVKAQAKPARFTPVEKSVAVVRDDGLAADSQPVTPPAVEASEPQLSDADALALAAFQPAAAAQGTPDQPCNLTGMLAEMLRQSPAVQQGLAELPAADRSVANAVNMWDGQWPEDSLSGGKGLLRAVLVKAVATARPDCLSADNRGPALFLIPDSSTTVVLAVGSGTWRWGDLLTAMPGPPADYFLSLASALPAHP